MRFFVILISAISFSGCRDQSGSLSTGVTRVYEKPSFPSNENSHESESEFIQDHVADNSIVPHEGLFDIRKSKSDPNIQPSISTEPLVVIGVTPGGGLNTVSGVLTASGVAGGPETDSSELTGSGVPVGLVTDSGVLTGSVVPVGPGSVAATPPLGTTRSSHTVRVAATPPLGNTRSSDTVRVPSTPPLRTASDTGPGLTRRGLETVSRVAVTAPARSSNTGLGLTGSGAATPDFETGTSIELSTIDQHQASLPDEVPPPTPPEEFASYPPNVEAMRIIESTSSSIAVSRPTLDEIRAFQERNCPDPPNAEYVERNVEDPLLIPPPVVTDVTPGPLERSPHLGVIRNFIALQGSLNTSGGRRLFLYSQSELFQNGANLFSGRTPQEVWETLHAPELIRRLVDTNPSLRFDCSGLDNAHPSLCFVVMSLATTTIFSLDQLTSLTDAAAVQIADQIRLTEFCRQYAEKIQTNINQIFDSQSEHAWGRTILNIEVRKIFIEVFLGRWLKFCPNLNTLEIRDSRIKALKRIIPRRGIIPHIIQGVNREHPFLSVRREYISFATPDELLSEGLRVEFLNETDFGKVITNGWFHGVMEEILSPQTRIFMTHEAERYIKLIPVALNDPLREEKLEIIFDAGKMFAATIASGRQISHPLTLPFLAKLLGKVIAWNSMNSFNHRGCRDRARVVIDTQTYEAVPFEESLRIPDTVSANWPIELENRSALMDIAITNISTFDAENELEIFARGFFSIIPKDAVKNSGLRATDLQALAFGSETIDAQNMLDTWVNRRSSCGDQRMGRLQQILRDFDETQLRKFMKFISGSPQVPLEGFSGTGFRISIECRDFPSFDRRDAILRADEIPPKARTDEICIELYPYSTIEIMRERILEAINADSVSGD